MQMFTPVLRCKTCGFIAEISDVHNNTREHDCSKFSEASKSLHKQSAAMPPARNGIVNAEQYLNEALGGNMNISTLKPLAWHEIMEGYAQHKILEAQKENSTTRDKIVAILSVTPEIRDLKSRVATLELAVKNLTPSNNAVLEIAMALRDLSDITVLTNWANVGAVRGRCNAIVSLLQGSGTGETQE